MRKPKLGDILVISEYYDENEERIIDSAADLPRMAEVVKVIQGAVFADDVLSDYTYQILVGFPEGSDKWRMAVEEGDRLVVTRICKTDVDPKEVTAMENEFNDVDNLIVLSERVIPTNFASDVLELSNLKYGDKWEFAEESPHTEDESAKEVCGDICDSYNDVVAKDDVEAEYVPQSFSDFNASSGGGKTLKDYTGVGFTKEELAFKSSHEKALESLTAGSLAFSPIEEGASDNVNHPSHYNYGDIEVIDMLEALSSGYSDSTDAYLISTAAKYLYRADHKGKKVEDWKKAVWYIERAIEREEAHNE